MISSTEARRLFFNFFKDKAHTIVPSAPMVNKDDSSLMFVNAGMNQFKDYFLGTQSSKDSRIANTQKCLRVSGKHNDLEEVGRDTYHHTMFEMMGNWSFGDYFKEEAIRWAWQLLTETYKIDEKRLYVTVFEGDKKDDLQRDTETYDIWKELLSENRILDGSKKDNFWEMGEQGPCGPCSEIHIDLRSEEEKNKIAGSTLVNTDHPLVIEIWNLVFIQYNRNADNRLEHLPEKHVDTGMGFERICMVLQNKTSNYDTDIFMPLIVEIETITGINYGINSDKDVAIRVIVDHLRAVAFSIADGQLPSNNGAGYVIRRILRRAVRYYYTFLNAKEPLVFRLVDVLAAQFREVFPELKEQRNLISNVIREEESSFLRTLGQGLGLLDTIIDDNKKTNIILGEKAFELYDTYGFPIDLTALILQDRGYELDKKGFDQQLRLQKERSKSVVKTETLDWQTLLEDSYQEFVGYDHLQAKVRITRYRKIIHPKMGKLYQLVFNITPFYAEGGGQVGDKGYLEATNGDVFYIIDTKKENNLSVHITKNLPKKYITDSFTAVVDPKQRHLVSCNHTATHLLQQALRSVLGDHIQQKGSMVHSTNLRFDFSHFTKLTKEELKQVEGFVNSRIREQIALEDRRNVPYQQAIQEDVIAIFGEKYGDTVRTIRFGKSHELCGGTHVENTVDIWHFVITGETAVAAGIRRIEAITSDIAKDYFVSQSNAYNDIKTVLKDNEPSKNIKAMQEEMAAQKKLIDKLLKEKQQRIYEDLVLKIEEINNVQFLAQQVDIDASGIKDLVFRLGNHSDNLFIVLASAQKSKAVLTCYVSKALVEKGLLDASKIIKKLSQYIGGNGGGQAFFATAGGNRIEGITQALKEAKDYL